MRRLVSLKRMHAATLPDLGALPLVAMPDTVLPPAEDLSATLTAAIRAGSETAFERFHAIYAARLYRYALVLARGDEHEAREVAQTVWIKVAARCEVCANENALCAWLRCVTRNAFIDQCRARSARERRIVSMDEDATEPATENNLNTALAAGLRTILDELPADERELLQAAYVDEQPLTAIAAAAGTTYKALESKLGRLRARLRARLLKLLHHES
jgi:RNA polymerase sigma-70 factor, ECF subfamily